MKAEQYTLINHEVKKSLIAKIMDIDCNGKTGVIIKGVGSKTEQQHKLDYKWSGEIFRSGIGWHDKTAEDAHARSKWMFALPHFLAGNDEIFIAQHEFFIQRFGHDKKKCLEYARDYIHTKKLSKEQAQQYMNDKQNYWLDRGVNLTNPNDYGLEFYYRG